MSSNDESKVDGPSEPKGQPTKNGMSKFAGLIVSRERVFDVLSTIITAIFTVVLAVSTLLLWKETRDLRDFAQEQSNDMKASIAEAARSATAMQEVATAVAANTKAANEGLGLSKDANARMMRAYLNIGFGGVINQDKTTNYCFEVRMILQNNGNTPAYKVRNIARVSLLPVPLPSDFDFPLAPLSGGGSVGVLGPHQNFILNPVADQIYSDEDVHDIQFGGAKQLYVYGTVTYEDAYGVERHINFSQRIAWLKGGNFLAFNTPAHNDSD
jgi:hypothetical protein